MYITKSLKDGKLYFGSTSNLKTRLKEHNSGLVKSAKSRRPLRVIYLEGYLSEREARRREHNLKLNARALRQLMTKIKESASL